MEEKIKQILSNLQEIKEFCDDEKPIKFTNYTPKLVSILLENKIIKVKNQSEKIYSWGVNIIPNLYMAERANELIKEKVRNINLKYYTKIKSINLDEQIPVNKNTEFSPKKGVIKILAEDKDTKLKTKEIETNKNRQFCLFWGLIKIIY